MQSKKIEVVYNIYIPSLGLSLCVSRCPRHPAKESSRDTWNQTNYPHLWPNADTVSSLVPAFPQRLYASSRNPSDRKLKNNLHEN
jgi:hypothetical protein